MKARQKTKTSRGKTPKKFRCPLCGSVLTKTRYYEIVGVWQERMALEKSLKKDLQSLRQEKRKLQDEQKTIRTEMKKQLKKAVKDAPEKATEKEKRQADRLSKMIQGKTSQIRTLNKTIKELEEQLKRGTTPQTEGLNLEEELLKNLKREFPKDKVEHHGKNGDIVHRVNFKKKEIGVIVYECKKTARFSRTFVDQTKRAVGSRRATYGVLVTTASKKDTAGFWVEKNVLIVHPYGAIHVARFLRDSIIELYSLRITRKEMAKRSQALMQYIKSDDFKNNIDDTIYRAGQLYETLKKEIKTHRGIWEGRYKHYKVIYENTSRMQNMTSNILKGLPANQALAHGKLKELPPPEEMK